MKFCPYCGATLMGSAAAFCSECGKPITATPEESHAQPEYIVQNTSPAANPTGRTSNEHPRPGPPRPRPSPSPVPGYKHPGTSQTRNKKPTGKRPVPPARPKTNQNKKRVQEHVPVRNPMDENYDGYYNDVPTDDNGYTKERLDPELIKRVILIAAGTVAIVILSVVVMYLL